MKKDSEGGESEEESFVRSTQRDNKKKGKGRYEKLQTAASAGSRGRDGNRQRNRDADR